MKKMLTLLAVASFSISTLVKTDPVMDAIRQMTQKSKEEKCHEILKKVIQFLMSAKEAELIAQQDGLSFLKGDMNLDQLIVRNERLVGTATILKLLKEHLDCRQFPSLETEFKQIEVIAEESFRAQQP